MASSTSSSSREMLPVALLWLMVMGFAGGFHALGMFEDLVIDWSDPVGWLGAASPEIALAATVRVVGLTVCCWISLTTVLYALAGRRGRTPSWLSRITFPPVRRLVDGALSSGLAASIVLAPVLPATAIEDEPPPVVFEIHEGVPVPHLHLGAEDPVVTSESDNPVSRPSPQSQTAIGAGDSPGTARVIASDLYAVLPGDNLWMIATRQLEVALSRAPGNSEVTAYWRQIIESNQSSLRSGDPNLIFPGELITLPSLTDQ